MPDTGSVLVVEDEALIAMDIEATLEDLGWSIIGPAANSSNAMSLIESSDIDIALLDFNLRDETSEHLAAHLIQKSIPVIFLSGDSLDQLGSDLASCTVLSKPLNLEHVDTVLKKTLGESKTPK